MDWIFVPHTILLRRERKEAGWAKGRPAKNADMRAEYLGSEGGMKEKK
jgi:hypothetical protein